MNTSTVFQISKTLSSALLIIICNLWFGAGLFAPLTPSEGFPDWVSVTLFWLMPLGGLWITWKRSKSRTIKLAAAISFFSIFLFYAFFIFVFIRKLLF